METYYKAEKRLHEKWFNKHKDELFKDDFIKFVETFDYNKKQEPNRRKIAKVFIYQWFGKSPKLKHDKRDDLADPKIKNAKLFLDNKKKAAKPLIIIASFLVGITVSILLLYEIVPSWFGSIQNFESHVALECAQNYKGFKVSPSDCSKFSPGSMQNCVYLIIMHSI